MDGTPRALREGNVLFCLFPRRHGHLRVAATWPRAVANPDPMLAIPVWDLLISRETHSRFHLLRLGTFSVSEGLLARPETRLFSGLAFCEFKTNQKSTLVTGGLFPLSQLEARTGR